jgi:photosystem II PsbH protein
MEQPNYQPNYQPKKVAPLQYALRRLNSEGGKVSRGWATSPLMALLILFFFVFLLIIVQIYNASILLEGIDIDWSALSQYSNPSESQTYGEGKFSSTGLGITLGLLTFSLCCVAFILYGATTYPKNQK